MVGIQNYSVFVSAAVLLNLTPGPDTMYILGKSISEGRKSGIASVFGIATGTLGHTLAAALGLSAILMKSAVAFGVVKYIGAGYLVFIGIKTLTSKNRLVESSDGSPQGPNAWYAYRQGAITNLLNPKVALFFLALLPQFVDRTSSNPMLAFLLLGMTFICTGTLWCLLVAWFAADIGTRVKRSMKIASAINNLTGLLFVGLGVRLATIERR
jgi:threonine/homoserine/homoserine lactone efflux protein